jgi:monoamine oxidase
MKRREALKYLGFGLSSSMLGSATVLTSCKKDDPGPEVPFEGTVVIIGAGAAGLYAADILTSKGINVTVLEATDRIGGRLKSLRNISAPSDSVLFPVIPDDPMAPISTADFAVELGAESFIGLDSPWGKIVSNLNLNVIDITAADHKYVLDNLAKNATDWQADADFTSAQRFILSAKDYQGASQTIRQAAAAVGERAQPLINSQLGNFYGSSSDAIGIAGLAENMRNIQHENKIFALKNNPMQDMLISRFARILPLVQMSKPVKSISHAADKVTIALEDGSTLEANKVIVTVPVSILKSGSITFSPSLPSAKLSALDKLGMDSSIRVILDFKKNLWGETTGYIWGGRTAPQYFNGGVGRSQFYRTLSITINGPKAVELSAKGKGMITDILAELDSIYSGQATQFVRRSLVTNEIMYTIQDWSKEKYIKGGFSYPKPSARITDLEALSTPVNDSLFFAGEATDITGDAGTINGALTSAERVANEVIQSIIAAA